MKDVDKKLLAQISQQNGVWSAYLENARHKLFDQKYDTFDEAMGAISQILLELANQAEHHSEAQIEVYT